MELKIYSKTYGEHILLFDKEDTDIVMMYEWSVWKMRKHKDYLYAAKTIREKGKKQKTVYLHRLLLNAKKGEVVDHINHNTLDNRRENLRLCLPYQNQRNLRKTTTLKTTSVYKGVCFGTDANCWLSYISINNKTIVVGRFKTEKSAARAYNKAAVKYYGDFACLNDV